MATESDPRIGMVDGISYVIFMPYREAGDRKAAFLEAHNWWAQRADVIATTVDSRHERFNLSASRNLGIRAAAGMVDVVVIADADTVVMPTYLHMAIQLAYESGQVHLPYSRYRSLKRTGWKSGDVIEAAPFADLTHVAQSGIYVGRPSAFIRAGMFDPRFTVWAPEDYAFWNAHDTLLRVQPGRRHIRGGIAWALPHADPPSKGEGPAYLDAVALYRRYKAAAGDRLAMQALVDEWQDASSSSEHPSPVR